VQQSIDMFRPPGPQQQTCSAAAAVCCCRPMLGQTDGRTDGHGTVVQTLLGTLCGQYQQITCKRRRTVCRSDVISRTVITRAMRLLTWRSIYARNENDNFCIYGRPCTRHRTNAEVRAVSGCPPLSNMVTERRFGCTSHAVLLMKTITVQLLLRFASLHQTGNDLHCRKTQPHVAQSR